MDDDPAVSLERIARQCAHSKYSIAELEQIYWNEVRPAVQLNLHSVAGQWAGFERNWLSERILKKHRCGRRLPIKVLHPAASDWWTKLRATVERIRMKEIRGSDDLETS